MSERPGTGELVAGIAGFVLILSMFIFGWFGLEGFGVDAFEALDDWVTIVLVFTAFAGMALMLFGPDIPRADVAPLGAVTLTLGALGALIILIQIIAPPSVSAGPVSTDLDAEFGVWLGLIATIAVAIGGYLALQEEGALSAPPRADAAQPPQAPPPPPYQQPPVAPQQTPPPPPSQPPPPPPPPAG